MFGLKSKRQQTIEEVRARKPRIVAVGQGPAPKYYVIEDLPEGTVIKKIFTRQSKNLNKWRVGYHNAKTVYYGHTLEGALQEFFKNNPKFLARYWDNQETGGQ